MKRNFYWLRYLTRPLGDAKIPEYMNWLGVILLGITLIVLLPLIETLHMVHWIGAALFTPSPALNELRKKAGSDVFTKNKAGAVMKKRTKPNNPSTHAQLYVRADTSNLAKTWDTPAVDQIAYNTYASENPVKNRLGLSMYINGNNWFLKLNRVIDYLGGTRVMNGPGASVVFQLLTNSNYLFSTTPFQLILNLLIQPPSSDIYYLVYVSKPLKYGVFSNKKYRLLTSLPSTGTYLTSKAAQMINGSTGFIVGANGMIMKTVDGGNSYSNQYSGVTVTLNAVSFRDVNNGIVVGNYGTILVTSNGGVTWTIVNYGGNLTKVTLYNLYGVAYNSSTLAMICGQNGVILISTDGGQTWTQQTSGVNTDLNSIAINPATPANAIAVGAAGNTVYTLNTGTLWNNVVQGTNKLFSVAIDPTGANAYAVGQGATIIYSADDGVSWTAQTSPVASVTLECVTATAASTAYICGAAGTILNTVDAGTTWTQETPPAMFANAELNSISFGNANVGIIAGEGGSSGVTSSVYMMTTSGGTTWVLPTAAFGYIYSYNVTSQYISTYATPKPGSKVFVKVEQASISTGFTNKPGEGITGGTAV